MALHVVDFQKTNSNQNVISEYELIKLISTAFGKTAVLMVTLSNVLESLSAKLSSMNSDLKALYENSKIMGITADVIQGIAEPITGLCISLGVGLAFFKNILDKDYTCESPANQKFHLIGNKIAAFFYGYGTTADVMALVASESVALVAKSVSLPAKVKNEKLKAFIEVYNKLIDTVTGGNDSASQTLKSLTDASKAIMMSDYNAETHPINFK
jgi:hypothetical protein